MIALETNVSMVALVSTDMLRTLVFVQKEPMERFVRSTLMTVRPILASTEPVWTGSMDLFVSVPKVSTQDPSVKRILMHVKASRAITAHVSTIKDRLDTRVRVHLDLTVLIVSRT